ncbi:MAG TPA: tetratricopeptide repeat protein, partial [Candidatus Acidoferrum sp.]|nr:tetratricopeptide repeat protein [Candidatus Acidoferrum sp.]
MWRMVNKPRRALVSLLAISLSLLGYARAEDHLKSLVAKAFDLHQKGEFSQALPLLHRAYELAPDDYFVNLLLGIDLLRTGQPKSAVSLLKRASRLKPKEDFPLDYLGEAYARQELYGAAA